MKNALLLAGILATFQSYGAMLGLTETPLYLEIPIGSGKAKTGSGFFLIHSNSVLLVTAKHVLFSPASSGDRLSPVGANLVITGLLGNRQKTDAMSVNLDAYAKSGGARYSPTSDVAVLNIGILDESTTEQGGAIKWSVDGRYVSRVIHGNFMRMGHVRKFADVKVGDEIYTFGYPTSVGSRYEARQLDPKRPLAKRGCVSDKNPERETLVLDLSIYFGNSGGPVIAVTQKGGQNEYRVIGVVTQFIPFEDVWINERYPKYPHVSWSNSGYSIAEPIDRVLDLIK